MIRSSKVLSYVMSSLSTFSALSVNKKTYCVSTRVLLAACATMFLLIMLWLATSTGIVYTTAH